MRNNPLDDIVKCTVEISSPASNDATFDSILLIVPEPKTPGESTMNGVTAISKADELLDYGFTTEDRRQTSCIYVYATQQLMRKETAQRMKELLIPL